MPVSKRSDRLVVLDHGFSTKALRVGETVPISDLQARNLWSALKPESNKEVLLSLQLRVAISFQKLSAADSAKLLRLLLPVLQFSSTSHSLQSATSLHTKPTFETVEGKGAIEFGA